MVWLMVISSSRRFAETQPEQSTGPLMDNENQVELPVRIAGARRRAGNSAEGNRFSIGVALYDGDANVSFGDGLYAVPIRAPWEIA